MEELKNEESWNKKRIFIAVFLLALLMLGGYFFKTRVLSEKSSQPEKSVEGIGAIDKNIQPEPEINIQKTVREKIDSLKQEVSGLNVLEIASSSPQVQKILRDIKSLEQYPVNQARDMCKKICESF